MVPEIASQSRSFNPVGRQLAWAAAIAAILTLCLGLATFAVFPNGGGVYHAVFAYSNEGRLDVARFAYGVALFALSAPAAVLVWVAPVRWWAIALIASALGGWFWWGICTWQPQSPGFTRGVLTLLPGIPLILTVVCALADHTHRAWIARAGTAGAKRPAA